MKKIINFIAIATVLIASCTKSVNTPAGDNNNVNSSNSTMVTGEFKITKFTDRNLPEDKTADFAAYKFTFTTDGKIAAVKDSVTVSGSYTEKPSHEGESAKLSINFSDAPLNELNKNWHVNLISKNDIHLSDDDATSGEVLEFTAQ